MTANDLFWTGLLLAILAFAMAVAAQAREGKHWRIVEAILSIVIIACFSVSYMSTFKGFF